MREKYNGRSKHPLYQRWAGMRARCNNPGHVAYERYGGAGIKVCDRWDKSFDAFLEDMGEAPEGHTLDRHPNANGNYEPGNCRWATTGEQNRNTCRNVWIEIDGERLTVRDWEAKRGLKRGAIQRRIDLGWDHKRAVLESLQPGKPLRTRE